MPEVTATVHKDGLHPMEAFKAHHLSQELGMSLDDIFAEGDVRNPLPQGALRVVSGHQASQGHEPRRHVAEVQVRELWQESSADYRGRQAELGVCAEVTAQAFLHLSLHQARAQVQGPAPDDQSLVGRARLERERAR